MNDKNLLFSGTDIDARIAELSPDKRALLLKRISRGNKDPGGSPVLRTDERSLEPSFALLPIVALSRTGDLPLSFAQQRLWFLDRLLPDQGSIPDLFGLHGGPERWSAVSRGRVVYDASKVYGHRSGRIVELAKLVGSAAVAGLDI